MAGEALDTAGNRRGHGARVSLLAIAALIAVASVAACSTPRPQPTEKPIPGNLTPYPKRTFARGPNLVPFDALITWLDAHAEDTVRLPVTFTFDRISIQSARLGPATIWVNDSALGVSLVDRVNELCPGGGTCTVRLIGTWGGMKNSEASFNVHQVDGLMPDLANYAELETASQPRSLP